MKAVRESVICTGSTGAIRIAVCVAVVLVCAMLFSACGKKSDPFLPVQPAPRPVKHLRAVARPDAIVLVWRAPGENTNESPLIDLAGFRIYRADEPFSEACLTCPKQYIKLYDHDYRGPRGKVPGKGLFVYRDTSPGYKTLFTYRVSCYNENDVTGPVSEPVHVYFDVPPAAPGMLRLTRRYRVIRLAWKPPEHLEDGGPADSIAGYNIYRSARKSDAERFPLNREPVGAAAFEDIPPQIDSTYFYRVRAVRRVRDTLIESAPTEWAEIAYMDVTPPGVPQGLTAIPVEAGVMLKWMPKTEKDFAGFNIYRKEPKQESFTRMNKGTVTGSTWIDRTAEKRASYVYGVTAVDRSASRNESALSKTVEVLYIIK